MAAFFANLRNTVIAGLVLLLLVLALYIVKSGVGGAIFSDKAFWLFVLRYCHIISGVMWIGLLYYFNFVSTPTTPSIPVELRPALGKFITPAALFWFRWSAMSTLVFGALIAGMKPVLSSVEIAYTLTLDINDPGGAFATPSLLVLGIGMWFAIIMWFNVWFVIWPNQQKALNIGNRYPDLSADAKAAAAKTAGMFSRINTMLSIPMLFCMAASPHLVSG